SKRDWSSDVCSSDLVVFWVSIGLLLLIVSIIVSLSIGTAHLPLPHVWGVLMQKIPYLESTFEGDLAPSTEQIIMKVRLPRVVLEIGRASCRESVKMS